MSSTDCTVLLGHQDGSLTLHEASDFDAPTLNISQDGFTVFESKLCQDGSLLALVESDGEFFFRHFSSVGAPVGQPIPFADEYIQVFMAANDVCDTVVVAGVTIAKAHILKIVEGQYQIVKEINDQHPLSAVDVNEEGDLVLLSRIATHSSSILYSFSLCSDSFQPEQVIESGDYDEANSINTHFLVQGNEAGTIQVTRYDWQFQRQCPSAAAWSSRDKSSVNVLFSLI